MKKSLALFFLGCVLGATGCIESEYHRSAYDERDTPDFERVVDENDANLRSALSKSYTESDLSKAIRSAALRILKRLPTEDEINQASSGFEGYALVLNTYLDSDAFYANLRNYFKNSFGMGDKVEDRINYNEPANLATYIAKNNLSYKEILTATYCVNDSLGRVDCANFSNRGDATRQAAGVLTTRAFLVKHSSPFNFVRTDMALQYFGCRAYPNSTDPGMSVEYISDKKATFNATSGEPVCASCHKAMNPIAAQFYVFDRKGFFNTSPNPNPDAGEITLDTIGEASDLSDILVGSPQTVVHNEPVDSVRSYALLLSQNKLFRDCMAQRFANFALGNGYKEELPADMLYLRDKVDQYDFRIKPLLRDIFLSERFVKLR